MVKYRASSVSSPYILYSHPFLDRFAKHLREKAVAERKAKLMASYREKSDIKLLTSPVVEIASEGFPVRDNPKAPVTIVEIANYQCGYCKKVAEIMERIPTRFEGKVKLVCMDFPILSEVSRLVTRAGGVPTNKGKNNPLRHSAMRRDYMSSRMRQ